MPRAVLVAMGMLVALTGCGGGQISSEVLAETAIKGPAAEQEKAVLELGRRGPAVVPLLRRVVDESKSPVVRAAAIQSLGAYNDFPSGPRIFDAIDDPDPHVRGRAAAAITNIIGADYHYRADDPLPKRKAIAAAMRRSYDQMLGNPDLKR